MIYASGFSPCRLRGVYRESRFCRNEQGCNDTDGLRATDIRDTASFYFEDATIVVVEGPAEIEGTYLSRDRKMRLSVLPTSNLLVLWTAEYTKDAAGDEASMQKARRKSIQHLISIGALVKQWVDWILRLVVTAVRHIVPAWRPQTEPKRTFESRKRQTFRPATT